MSRHVRGFTMIELLVVITIIALLSGLVMTVINVLRERAKGTQTQSVMHQARMGLEAVAAQGGSLPVAVEHPLAASAGSAAAPRLAFGRSAEAVQAMIAQKRGGSTALSPNDLAIRGVDFEHLHSELFPRMLRDDDHFTDPRVPELVGLRRDQATILGVPLAGITRYRLMRPLPADIEAYLRTTMNDPSKPVFIDEDVEDTYFPDAQTLVDPPTTPEQIQPILAKLLSADVLGELVVSGSASAHDPEQGAAAFHDRVWAPNGLDGGLGRWEAGLIQTPESGGSWIAYRPQGMALVDAWGGTILYRVENGMAVFESAGQDGIFRVDPGPNGVIDTTTKDLRDGIYGGDDSDGSRDNQLVRAGREVE